MKIITRKKTTLYKSINNNAVVEEIVKPIEFNKYYLRLITGKDFARLTADTIIDRATWESDPEGITALFNKDSVYYIIEIDNLNVSKISESGFAITYDNKPSMRIYHLVNVNTDSIEVEHVNYSLEYILNSKDTKDFIKKRINEVLIPSIITSLIQHKFPVYEGPEDIFEESGNIVPVDTNKPALTYQITNMNSGGTFDTSAGGTTSSFYIRSGSNSLEITIPTAENQYPQIIYYNGQEVRNEEINYIDSNSFTLTFTVYPGDFIQIIKN